MLIFCILGMHQSSGTRSWRSGDSHQFCLADTCINQNIPSYLPGHCRDFIENTFTVFLKRFSCVGHSQRTLGLNSIHRTKGLPTLKRATSKKELKAKTSVYCKTCLMNGFYICVRANEPGCRALCLHHIPHMLTLVK